jgi:hypothetical protein
MLWGESLMSRPFMITFELCLGRDLVGDEPLPSEQLHELVQRVVAHFGDVTQHRGLLFTRLEPHGSPDTYILKASCYIDPEHLLGFLAAAAEGAVFWSNQPVQPPTPSTQSRTSRRVQIKDPTPERTEE